MTILASSFPFGPVDRYAPPGELGRVRPLRIRGVLLIVWLGVVIPSFDKLIRKS